MKCSRLKFELRHLHALVIGLVALGVAPFHLAAAPSESARWESAIQGFEAADKKIPPPRNATLFLGSSSIRKWESLESDFPEHKTIRRGFGGSHISDCLAYADRIVLPYEPATIVLYAGDNDLAAGKPPKRVLADFKALTEKVHETLPDTEIAFIAIKPSTARWHLIDEIREANQAIKKRTETDDRLHYIDIFNPMLGPDGQSRESLLADDGLHLSPAGYDLWTREVKAVIQGKPMERIRPNAKGTGFIRLPSNERFVAWGVNYDHDAEGRLLEDYWHDEWATVVNDFQEMRKLGVNVARIHLQVGQFLAEADRVNDDALARLERLVLLAERSEIYLILTGLACYHKDEVPDWYAGMNEAERWEVQAFFWSQIAKTCRGNPAVFGYDLMNEPILPGREEQASEWLAGEFGGKHFVQRITLSLDERSRKEVAKAWVAKLSAAIRKADDKTMITVGVIPWALTFPGAKPLFYSDEVAAPLDFASVHFYPKSGEVDRALKALKVYEVGKPLMIEEMFPLRCSIDELDAFIDGSRQWVDGWIGFYWGRTAQEYTTQSDPKSQVIANWLEYFRKKKPEL